MNNQNVPPMTLDDMEQIIIKAYHQAELLMNDLNLTETLKTNNLNDLEKLSLFVFRQLSKHSTADNSFISNNNDDDDEENSHDDIDSNNGTVNDCLESDFESSEDTSDEDNQDEYHVTTSRQTFQGMKIYDKINPTRTSHYFQIVINNKQKYIHKQTAARLLTSNKNSLSSDRLLRVQQMNKQQ